MVEYGNLKFQNGIALLLSINMNDNGLCTHLFLFVGEIRLLQWRGSTHHDPARIVSYFFFSYHWRWPKDTNKKLPESATTEKRVCERAFPGVAMARMSSSIPVCRGKDLLANLRRIRRMKHSSYS